MKPRPIDREAMALAAALAELAALRSVDDAAYLVGSTYAVDSHFKRHFPSPEENADNGSWTKPLARQLGGRANDGHRSGAGFHPDLTSSRGISIVSTGR